MPIDSNNYGWTFWVSIYAALISTLTAVWKIYEYYDDKKGNIKITILKALPGSMSEYYDEWDKESTVAVLITNVGKKNRHLKLPSFRISKSMLLPEHTQLTMKEVREYSIKLLAPGEEFRYDIPMWLLVKYRKAGASKIRVEITDTHKKCYKSKWEPI